MDPGFLTFSLWMTVFYSVEFHISFMDDSILFCQAKEIECQVIPNLLVVYEKGLDKKINRDKTNIFFSSNTH